MNTIRFRRGFLSVEMGVVLMVVIAGMVLGTQWLGNDAVRRTDVVAAEHAKVVADAAASFVKANYAAVQAAATPTATYTTAQIAAYLPASFNAQNPYGQAYSIRAFKTGANVLEVMVVTTGGETISEGSLRSIASFAGASGGYVSAQDTTRAQGTQGGWSMPFTNFAGTPGGGKLAFALFFQNGQQVADFLYRNAVAGKPELNTMNTSMSMGGNNITNANNITALRVGTTGYAADSGLPGGWGGGVHTADVYAEGTVGVGVGGAVQAYINNVGTVRGVAVSGGAITSDSEVTAQNWLRTNGDTGWYSNKWGGGWYMADATWVRSYGDKNIYTGGQVFAGSMRSSGRLQTSEFLQVDGVGTIGAACSGALIARDAAGNFIGCQQGVWKSLAGSTITQTPLPSTAFADLYTYTYTGSKVPLFLSVELLSGAYSNSGICVGVRWRNQFGVVIRDWQRISGSNVGSGNDGGSGMWNSGLATIPFMGAKYLDFNNLCPIARYTGFLVGLTEG